MNYQSEVPQFVKDLFDKKNILRWQNVTMECWPAIFQALIELGVAAVGFGDYVFIVPPYKADRFFAYSSKLEKNILPEKLVAYQQFRAWLNHVYGVYRPGWEFEAIENKRYFFDQGVVNSKK